jgi:hypothetical protein
LLRDKPSLRARLDVPTPRKFAFFTKQILVVRLLKTGTVVLTSDAVYLKEQG